jgi:WD40 repeat protein
MRSGRRLGWALAASTLAISLAGCVSMQDSGPPGTLEASSSGTTQDAANIAPIPALPGPNLKQPDQLISAFLSVSASYSTYPDIVKAYLTPQEAKVWNPQWSATVFGSFQVSQLPQPKKQQTAGKQATVTVQGQVQSTFSGTGQYLSAAQTSTPSSCARDELSNACERFTLVQVDGQWRISSLPARLLLDENDFSRVYQPQDLYYLDPTHTVLVPDTVFVPLGTPAQQTLTTLVCTLLPAGGCSSGLAPGVEPAAANQTWLTSAGATQTGSPQGTKLLAPVTVQSGIATVNLGGAIAQPSAQKAIPLIMAQLTWTLIGSSSGSVTAVALEINGTPELSHTNSTYKQFLPYPASQRVFTYVDGGVARSVCGASPANFSGPGAPVFGSNGVPVLASCGGASASPSPSATSSTGQQRSAGKQPPGTASAQPVSMVAASPDGGYLAGVSPSNNSVSIWTLKTPSAPVLKWSQSGQTVNSISWDRQHDLWIVTRDSSTQKDSVFMLSAMTGKVTLATFASSGNVLSLSVAPDGVRAALIVQNGSGAQQVQLAGIERAVCPTGTGSACKPPGSVDVALSQGPQLGGPSVIDAISLSWYDQDNLAVLNQDGAASDLLEVPVSGRSPSGPYTVSLPAASGSDTSSSSGVYAESIAAGNLANVLVVAMSDGQLLYSQPQYSTGFNNEVWRELGPGSAPAYGVSGNP